MASPELRIYRDVSRDRRLPVRLYPGRPDAPLILFSPGFGGTCWDYAGLLRTWSEAGYRVAALEHPGSSLRAALRLAPRRLFRSPLQLKHLAHTPAECRHRPLDVAFVRERLGGDRVGVAGHSFGAYTALATALELKVAAVLALSPHPPGWVLSGADYGRMSVPSLLITGTRDRPLEGRLEAHRLMGGPSELLVVDGARHMDFAGWGPARVVEEAAQAGLNFWRRTLPLNAKGSLP